MEEAEQDLLRKRGGCGHVYIKGFFFLFSFLFLELR